MSDRALAARDARSSPVQSFYLDISMLRRYWHQRAYHHTAPVSMIFALREGLRLLMEEGLEPSWQRHSLNAVGLRAGLKAMGLRLVAQEGYRLPCLTTVWAPEGVDEAAVRRHLLERYDTDIGAGIGELAGRSWRIGLMGYNSTSSNVFHLLSILEEALMEQGYEVPMGASLAAAQQAIHDGRLPA
jgi:alanine-glyoxylate transaminase/serine-glyoxylate transaminase/serine-pyruvate transaminase